MRICAFLPLLLIVCVLRLSAAPATAAPATGMSDDDSEHLLVHFEMTGQVLAGTGPRTFSGATGIQGFPRSMSIRECVSHLAVAEPDYWRDPDEVRSRRPRICRARNHRLRCRHHVVRHRSRCTYKKPAAGTRRSTLQDMGVALAKFQALRAIMIEYISPRTTTCAPIASAPRSQSIAGSGCSKSPTHAERHIQQIREIKADPNFPKSLSRRDRSQGIEREEADASNHRRRVFSCVSGQSCLHRTSRLRPRSSGSTTQFPWLRWAHQHLSDQDARGECIHRYRDRGPGSRCKKTSRCRKPRGHKVHHSDAWPCRTTSGGIDLWKEPGTQIIAQRNYVNW